MINLEEIERIIRLAVLSGRIKNEIPLSLMIISEQEAGKSSVIRKNSQLQRSVMYVTDATAYGIIRDTQNLELFEKGHLTHLIIPDLCSCLSRKSATVRTFMNFMRAMIEEGVVDISTFATKIATHTKKKKTIRCGFITSITKDYFYDQHRAWNKIGFLSRVLPITYKYSVPTRLKILSYIQKQEYHSELVSNYHVPRREINVSLPEDFAKMVQPYAITLADAQKHYGFRLQRQFQVLLKAIALERRSLVVEEQDWEIFQELCKYINLDFNVI